MSDGAKSGLPDLAKYVDKRVMVRLHENRKVSGVLRGYDQFMNVVMHGAAEENYDGSSNPLGETVVRGNTIVNIELLQAA